MTRTFKSERSDRGTDAGRVYIGNPARLALHFASETHVDMTDETKQDTQNDMREHHLVDNDNQITDRVVDAFFSWRATSCVAVALATTSLEVSYKCA